MRDLQHVKEFSRREMPNKPFHDFRHATRVAEVASSLGSETELLKVAGFMHDIGHRDRADGHEQIGADIARQKLPEWGYNKDDAERVAQAIKDTELFKAPSTRMGTVLSDADTHNFGLSFDKFKSISLKVKQEEAPNIPRQSWWEGVIDLLNNHSYHGPGKTRFGPQKKDNIDRLEKLVKQGETE